MSEPNSPPLLDDTPLTSPHFVVGPQHLEGVGVPILITLVPAGEEGAWLVVSRPEMVSRDLASLALALCAMQRSYPFILPTLTAPSQRTCFIAIGTNGAWTDHRKFRYPDQIRTAIQRTRSNLEATSPHLIEEMYSALQGRRPATWSRVPKERCVLDDQDVLSMLPDVPVDLQDTELMKLTFDVMGTAVTHDYNKERYLEHLSDDELQQRAAEALLNCYELAGSHHWTINPFDRVQGRAFARFEETVQEAEIRGAGGWKDLVVKAVATGFRVGANHNWQRASGFFDRDASSKTSAIARFGRHEHLVLSRSEGLFRLSPASAYNDTSLGNARFDTELESVVEENVRRSTITVVDPDTGAESPITAFRATRRKRSSTDALLLCFSRRVSPRLFKDFNADSCLVIHDLDAFHDRVIAATALQLRGWRHWRGDVQYYDPFSRKASNSAPLYSKSIGFAYQYEHRLLWVPPFNCESVDATMLRIGSIADISELVSL